MFKHVNDGNYEKAAKLFSPNMCFSFIDGPAIFNIETTDKYTLNDKHFPSPQAC